MMNINALRPLDGVGKKLFVETYGCQMNVGDTEIVISILQQEGYRYTERIEEADVILINTCSVRDNAEQRIWGRLADLRRFRKAKPSLRVGIIGCMAERLKERLTEGRDAVEIVAGPDAYRDLPRLFPHGFRHILRQLGQPRFFKAEFLLQPRAGLLQSAERQ